VGGGSVAVQTCVSEDRSLIQLAERALADAEEALRRDPSADNERKVWRAWQFVRRAREEEPPVQPERSHELPRSAGTLDDMTPETCTFDDDGRIPNSPLPVILYRGVSEAKDAASCEELFATHRWLGAWRDGIFSFHHFHSTAHEVLGIVRGQVTVMLGGPNGRSFELGPGDVAVLPAGTGHCNAGSSADLLVVGAYPNAMRWDIRRGEPGEREEVLANIRAVPLPESDPVNGEDGSLVKLWRGAAAE